jgi:hypothetical protein
MRLDDEFGEPLPDDWERLGTPPADTRIWWCAPNPHLGRIPPGGGHPHWTMPAYCYWTGTVDHNEHCGWVGAAALQEREE